MNNVCEQFDRRHPRAMFYRVESPPETPIVVNKEVIIHNHYHKERIVEAPEVSAPPQKEFSFDFPPQVPAAPPAIEEKTPLPQVIDPKKRTIWNDAVASFFFILFCVSALIVLDSVKRLWKTL